MSTCPSTRVVRAMALAACVSAAAARPALRAEQPPSDCGVSGIVTSGRTRLPGVVVSILDAAQHAIDVSASAADGSYTLKVPGAGAYVLKAEFSAFAPITRELTIDAADCRPRRQRASSTM